MKNEIIRFRLEIVALISSIIVIVFSAAELGGNISMARLIGLIAGSFGAGASMASAVRSFGERRLQEKQKEAA